MRRVFICLFVLSFFVGCLPEVHTANHQKVVLYSSDNTELAGTLTFPARAENVPAVLLIGGSGPHERTGNIFGHPVFEQLADALARRGVAVLSMDKRGCGESGGRFVPYNVPAFTEDAHAAIAWLRDQPVVDSERVGVLGLSLGAMISAIVAEEDSKIAFVVHMAGPGFWGINFFSDQAQTIALASGFSEDDCVAIDSLYQRLGPYIEKDSISPMERWEATKLIRELMNYEDRRNRELIGATDPNALLHFLRGRHLREFMHHDPARVLRSVACPVLVLNGTRDTQVNWKRNVPAVEAALKEGECRSVTVAVLKDHNHHFQHCQTGLMWEYPKIQEGFSRETVTTICDWIVEQTK